MHPLPIKYVIYITTIYGNCYGVIDVTSNISMIGDEMERTGYLAGSLHLKTFLLLPFAYGNASKAFCESTYDLPLLFTFLVRP